MKKCKANFGNFIIKSYKTVGPFGPTVYHLEFCNIYNQIIVDIPFDFNTVTLLDHYLSEACGWGSEFELQFEYIDQNGFKYTLSGTYGLATCKGPKDDNIDDYLLTLSWESINGFKPTDNYIVILLNYNGLLAFGNIVFFLLRGDLFV